MSTTQKQTPTLTTNGQSKIGDNVPSFIKSYNLQQQKIEQPKVDPTAEYLKSITSIGNHKNKEQLKDKRKILTIIINFTNLLTRI